MTIWICSTCRKENIRVTIYDGNLICVDCFNKRTELVDKIIDNLGGKTELIDKIIHTKKVDYKKSEKK